MEFGAFVMMLFGLGITWGGASLCFRIAFKNQ
ncbi:MetS family NSS transporter small subunit [Maridesulfovibrio sp.]